MNILAIAAHPDDAEIYCGGTLTLYERQGHNVKICMVTSGNIGHYDYDSMQLAEIRKEEQINAAAILGAEVMFLGLEERIEDTTLTRNAIINAIRWANPDIIFTHNPVDSSIDHAIIGTIVKQSLLALKWGNLKTEFLPIQKLPTVYFWDTNGGINFQPTTYVDISEVMDLKKEMLACHKSQIELEQDYMRVVDVLSAFRGLQAGCLYAEGFIAHNSFENPPNYKLLP